MLRFRPYTSKKAVPTIKSPSIKRTLQKNESVGKRKKSLVWGMVNFTLLGLFLYDLSYKCPRFTSWFNYIEYLAVIILTLNTLYHSCRYIYYTKQTEAITENEAIKAQKIDPVLHLSSFNEEEQVNATHNPLNVTFETSTNYTPLNWSAVSWRSSSSPNESHNCSVPSPSWVYHRGVPEQKTVSATEQKSTLTSTPRKHQNPPDISGVDLITDEKSLNQYLYSYDQYEKALNANYPGEQNSNFLSSFWNHAAAQNPNELAPYLRKMQYQLSSQLPANITTSTGKTDETRTVLNVSSLGSEVWQKLQIEQQTLTQWNANLRMWISQTILDRLVTEITVVNDEFIKYHLNDVRIGSVGLERLRKTAQTLPVTQYIPTLTALLPFLEVSPLQEYLVKRIKELAKGGCMSEFKWNSGGNYNGKEWDETLVNDSEIIIHLLATYLDCQLVPLPNQPDAKPFSKEHFIRPNENVPHNPTTLAIHQLSVKPPHFRLVVGEEVFEVAKGHNNLFYTVLLFLYFVNKKEHGMLGKVNMGRSGVNMLWIIEES